MKAVESKSIQLKTFYKLGLLNVARVFVYRIALKAGYFRLRLPIGKVINGTIFSELDADDSSIEKTVTLRYFSFHDFTVSGTPDWFSNPWKSSELRGNSVDHWSKISDFTNSIGDIKTVWEASRFDWAPKFAWLSKHESNDNSEKVNTLEIWTRDWCEKNPPNQGINWKCGQEASLRILNILVAAKILDTPFVQPTDSLLQLMRAHLERVLPTTSYAIAQDNNHGTSEAVALFAIGAYLVDSSFSDKAFANRCCSTGRKLLENRIEKLIRPDGSFSQASVAYHRLMLDTVVLCESFRASFSLPAFSETFYERMSAATMWLYAMTDMQTGDTPNLGSNDGAYFLNIGDHSYRDFRPSLQRAMVIFVKKRLPVQMPDELLDLFGYDASKLDVTEDQDSVLFPDGGYGRLNIPGRSGHIIFRFPKYDFRYGHCDANHLDFWLNGRNWILDSGSYSYNPDDEEYSNFFSATRSHSTVAFDTHEQMPAISRFLRGEWLRPDQMKFCVNSLSLESAYTDFYGSQHKRTVGVENNSVVVHDYLSGFEKEAVLRWRLPNMQWVHDGLSVSCDLFGLSISADSQVAVEFTEEPNSLHYLQLETIPVLTVTVSEPSKISTQITF